MNNARMGQSIVFVVDGSAPADMSEVVVKMFITAPKDSLELTNMATITKEYFVTKFIVDFPDPGN